MHGREKEWIHSHSVCSDSNLFSNKKLLPALSQISSKLILDFSLPTYSLFLSSLPLINPSAGKSLSIWGITSLALISFSHPRHPSLEKLDHHSVRLLLASLLALPRPTQLFLTSPFSLRAFLSISCWTSTPSTSSPASSYTLLKIRLC